MKHSENIPKIKVGIVAVSRDCFPESLSVSRREALVVRCWVKSRNERNPYPMLPASKVGDSWETARDNLEEGGDDVKSSCPLCLGLHTYYNGRKQREAKPRGRANPRNPISVRIAGCNPPA